MSKETKVSNKTDKKKLYYSIIAILITAALIAGFSYAWFYNKTDMATLMEIKPPSNIAILGPNGKEMTSLELNYTNADKQGNTVTVRRVICVQSEISVNNYELEIVHTTNLKGLTFNLYPVNTKGDHSVTEDESTYNYNINDKISGAYLNQDNSDTTAKEYKYANNEKHHLNYGDYSKVQSHAEPLYWKVNDKLSPDININNQVTIENKKYNRTFYVCEVTWTETTKETDIFYILAQTA